MPEIINYKEEWNVVYVNSFGEVTLEEVQNSIQEVSLLMQQLPTKNLIVDVSKQCKPLELLETFTICKDHMPTLPPDMKIAYIVASRPQQSHKFFTLLSESLGFPVRAFMSIDNARYWFQYGYTQKTKTIGKVKFPSTQKS